MNTTLLKLDWTIDQFQSHTIPGLFIESPNFEPSNKCQIKLRMFPSGFRHYNSGVNILTYFESCELPEMNILFKFSLINSQGEHVHSKVNQGFYRKDSVFGFPEYIRRSYILDRASELLSDGKLRIHCELHISPGSEPPPPMDNQLVHDYAKLLGNSNFQGVIMCYGHKSSILSSILSGIVKNSSFIISTDKWTELMQTKPKLFNELFNSMAQTLNNLNLLDNLKIE